MKYTLITGASAGIGESMAKMFASKGHNLILVARRKDRLLKLKGELEAKYSIKVIVIVKDLSDFNAGEQLYNDCKNYDLEILINNAGYGDFANVWELNLDKINKMLNLNIQALAQLSFNFVRDYRDKVATLINVASTGGYKMYPSAAPYCATKFYVSSLTEGISANLKIENKPMRAKVLAPAGTATEFFDLANNLDLKEGNKPKMGQDYLSPDVLAEYTYELFESDMVVGIVVNGKELELKDPVFETIL